MVVIQTNIHLTQLHRVDSVFVTTDESFAGNWLQIESPRIKMTIKFTGFRMVCNEK